MIDGQAITGFKGGGGPPDSILFSPFPSNPNRTFVHGIFDPAFRKSGMFNKEITGSSGVIDADGFCQGKFLHFMLLPARSLAISAGR